jgi:IS605 OrfB family transposase
VGDPTSIDLPFDGLRASRRDGRLRAAIAQLLDHARHHGCGAIVVENLDFATARATGRETLGRGQRGKRLRHAVAGIPTRQFRNRLTSMASRCGIAVIGLDPAYTSKWGAQHWVKPLQQQTSDPDTVTRHHGAAVGIGRRGLGLAIRRRPAGPRNGQRTAVGTPPVRPTRHRGHGRHSSSGPPTCTPRGPSVRRKAPASGGQHRSGRTGLGPSP